MSSGICRSSAPSRPATPERAVTFLTLPSTRAKDLLAAEPCVGEVIYFEHQGSELARGINLVKLVALMRARKFQRIWILDRTIRPALAAMLAGIPERIGPGDGAAAPAHHQCGDRSAPFPRAGDGLAARAARVDERAGRLDRARPEAAASTARRHRGALRRRRGPGSCSRSAARIRARTGPTRTRRRCSTRCGGARPARCS